MPRRNYARQKGDRFERKLIADLQAAGITCHRVPLSGAVAGYPGDVLLDGFDPPLIVQCKHFANPMVGLFRAAVANPVTLVAEGAGEPLFLLMMQSTFITWANAPEAFPWSMPVQFLRFSVCVRWLEHEDLLFVKADRREPFVVFPLRTAMRILAERR